MQNYYTAHFEKMHGDTLASWLNGLENLQPSHEEKDFQLKSVASIAQKLDLFSMKKPVISVTGTNGKGSCVAFCEAILHAEGYRTGAYYSPHVFQFNERICVAGKPVSNAKIITAFQAIEKVRKKIRLSYFEFATLAALYIFKQEQVDVLLLEVGVGGRLDAVNIIDADVAVITSIALDHQHWLGNTREAIGKEKAGIFRSGKSAVCGDSRVPFTVAQQAAYLNTSLFSLNQDYQYEIKGTEWSWYARNKSYDHLPLTQLPIVNAATALQALELLQMTIRDSALKEGLKNASLPGRFHLIKKPVLQIFDVAHNPEAAEYFAVRLKKIACKGRTLAIFGILRDKEICNTLRPLLSLVNAWYLTHLKSSRAATTTEIAQKLTEIGNASPVFEYVDSMSAYQAALTDAGSFDRIIIFGSFHTIGEICPDND